MTPMRRQRWERSIEPKFDDVFPKMETGCFFAAFCGIFGTSQCPLFGPGWHTVFAVCRRGPLPIRPQSVLTETCFLKECAKTTTNPQPTTRNPQPTTHNPTPLLPHTHTQPLHTHTHTHTTTTTSTTTTAATTTTSHHHHHHHHHHNLRSHVGSSHCG